MKRREWAQISSRCISTGGFRNTQIRWGYFFLLLLLLLLLPLFCYSASPRHATFMRSKSRVWFVYQYISKCPRQCEKSLNNLCEIFMHYSIWMRALFSLYLVYLGRVAMHVKWFGIWLWWDWHNMHTHIRNRIYNLATHYVFTHGYFLFLFVHKTS